MLTGKWPAAIGAATGYTEAHARHTLRRLREAALIPTGPCPPPFTGREISRVLTGLCLKHLPTLAADVATLEAAPSRTVPTYGIDTAGDALSAIVEDLLASRVRALGAIEVNPEWGDVTLHSFDNDGLPVVQRFGNGDPQRYGLATATSVLPLSAVLSVARILTAR